MKHAVLTLIATLLACAPAQYPPAEIINLPELAAHHVDVVAPGRQCSGVLVAPDTVLTAAHCVNVEIPHLIVVPIVGPAVEATDVALDVQLDLAIVTLSAAVQGVPAMGGPAARPGDHVTAYGRCGRPTKRLRVGGAMMGLLIATGDQVCPGDSGGGWYDSRGRLVGITSARSTDGGPKQSSAVDVIRLGLFDVTD